MIAGQFDNKLNQSFLLWLDHYILDDGQAYTNHGSNFFNTNTIFGGFFNYAAPFKGMVADNSVANAQVPTGIWVGSTFIGQNSSNFSGIAYDHGFALFSASQSSTISGDYSVKDFNIQLSDIDEVELLFEKKFEIVPKTQQTLKGLERHQIPYPTLLVKKISRRNEPWSFGGTDNTIFNYRILALADTPYKRDAIESLLGDTVRRCFYLIEKSENPFNILGLTTTAYNYDTLIVNKSNDDKIFIDDVNVSTINSNYYEENFKETPLFTSIIDFELHRPRNFRS